MPAIEVRSLKIWENSSNSILTLEWYSNSFLAICSLSLCSLTLSRTPKYFWFCNQKKREHISKHRCPGYVFLKVLTQSLKWLPYTNSYAWPDKHSMDCSKEAKWKSNNLRESYNNRWMRRKSQEYRLHNSLHLQRMHHKYVMNLRKSFSAIKCS